MGPIQCWDLWFLLFIFHQIYLSPPPPPPPIQIPRLSLAVNLMRSRAAQHTMSSSQNWKIHFYWKVFKSLSGKCVHTVEELILLMLFKSFKSAWSLNNLGYSNFFLLNICCIFYDEQKKENATDSLSWSLKISIFPSGQSSSNLQQH